MVPGLFVILNLVSFTRGGMLFQSSRNISESSFAAATKKTVQVMKKMIIIVVMPCYHMLLWCRRRPMLAVLASVFTTPSPVAGSATPTATTYSLSSAASPASPSSRQSGPLSLVQIHIEILCSDWLTSWCFYHSSLML